MEARKSIWVLCGVLVVLSCLMISTSFAQVTSSGLTLPYKGEYGGGDAFTISTYAGRAGFFSTILGRDYDPNNMTKFDALHALSTTAGRAGFFQVNNSVSAAAALGASTNGRGPAIQADGTLAGVFNGLVRVNGALAVGGRAGIMEIRPLDALSVLGSIRVDQGNQNGGNLDIGSIKFGGGLTGEGITSKRTVGGNQNGLDFYTKSLPRISITNNGLVGLGTSTPSSTLDVAGSIRASGAIKAESGSFTGISSKSGSFSGVNVDSPGSNALMASTSGGGVAIAASSSGTSSVISARMTGTGMGASVSVQNALSKNAALMLDTSGQGPGIIIAKGGTVGHAAEIFTSNTSNASSTLKVTAVNASAPAAEFNGSVSVMQNALSKIPALLLNANGTSQGIMISKAGTTGHAAVISTTNTSSALKVSAANASADAAEFAGRVKIYGSLAVGAHLSKASGSFKIDHPLDPLNKNLYHSFVESPDMKNIYDGVATMDSNGEAVVVLPDWFEALNKNFRYQLTCIGGYGPVYIADEIRENRFRIAGGRPELKVSWQVTGIRQDAYANAKRIQVEEDKSLQEKGRYLHPEVYAVSAQ